VRKEGSLSVYSDKHIVGIFTRKTWLDLLVQVCNREGRYRKIRLAEQRRDNSTTWEDLLSAGKNH